MISFTLPIRPQPYERVARKRNGRMTVPVKSRIFKRDVFLLAREHRQVPLLNGPLKLTVRFIYKKPKRPEHPLHPAGRPDLDNLLKNLKDAFNNVIWTDDARVCQYGEGTGKYYDCTPNPSDRIEVTIEELKA